MIDLGLKGCLLDTHCHWSHWVVSLSVEQDTLSAA